MKIIQPKFVYCSGIKNITLAMLASLSILQVLAVFSGFFRVVFEVWLNRINIEQTLLEININVYLELFLLIKIVSSITYIFFIIWFVRVYINHQALTKDKTCDKTVSDHTLFLNLMRVISFLWIRWFWRIYEIFNEILQGKRYIANEFFPEIKYGKQPIRYIVFFLVGYGSFKFVLWKYIKKFVGTASAWITTIT